jgi:hypothetical protein
MVVGSRLRAEACWEAIADLYREAAQLEGSVQAEAETLLRGLGSDAWEIQPRPRRRTRVVREPEPESAPRLTKAGKPNKNFRENRSPWTGAPVSTSPGVHGIAWRPEEIRTAGSRSRSAAGKLPG